MDFGAHIPAQQLDAKLTPDNLWSSIWAAVPAATREYLSHTIAYRRRVGPLTVEACFQDLLLAGK